MTSTVPISTHITLNLLWLSMIDGDAAAQDRYLSMLDERVRGTVAALCDLAVDVQPMNRTAEARNRALERLKILDASFKILTTRR